MTGKRRAMSGGEGASMGGRRRRGTLFQRYLHELQTGLPRTAGQNLVIVVGGTLLADDAQHVLLVRIKKRGE